MTPLDETQFQEYVRKLVDDTGKATLAIIDLDGGFALRLTDASRAGWQGLLPDDITEGRFALLVFDSVDEAQEYILSSMNGPLGDGGYLEVIMPMETSYSFHPDSDTLH